MEAGAVGAGAARAEGPGAGTWARIPVPQTAAAAVILIGMMVLVGWAFDIRSFKTVLPGLVCMNPFSAVSFIAMGASILGRSSARAWVRRVAMGLPIIALTVGGTKLCDLFLGTHFDFDQLLFKDQLGLMPGLPPNRMAPNTALNFVLEGAAVCLSHRRDAYAKVYSLIIPSFLLAFLALMGYIFGVKPLYGLVHYIPMALHASGCFLLTCLALVYSFPKQGLAGLAASDGPGGILARRLIPAAILFPTILGWLKIEGQKHGFYDAEMGVALLMLSTMAGMMVLVSWSAASLNELDRSRRRVNQALEEAKGAAEAASRAKSLFLANMSHELRTPLNSIIGFTQLLLKNKQNRLLASDLNFLSRVAENGKHLLALINNILDLSKVEAGKMQVAKGPCRLDALIMETLSQLEGQVQGKPVSLRHQLPPGLSVLETDGGKLKQVLINLVGNAVKFTEKGDVTVSVDADAAGRVCAIVVTDTGIGIPEDRLEEIFEAFKQADNGFGRQFEGTGLGLTISRSLCTLLGYRLEVSSSPGAGSRFSILIAAEEACAPAGVALHPVSVR